MNQVAWGTALGVLEPDRGSDVVWQPLSLSFFISQTPPEITWVTAKRARDRGDDMDSSSDSTAGSHEDNPSRHLVLVDLG